MRTNQILVKKSDDFFYLPHVIHQPRFHRGRHSQRLVNAAEVVMDEVERDGVFVVLDFLAEPERETGKAPHVQPHGEVRSLNEAGAAMGAVGVAADPVCFDADALWRAVANRAAPIRPVNLHELHVVRSGL